MHVTPAAQERAASALANNLTSMSATDFLKAVLGTDGAQALEKAADRVPLLESVLVPRTIVAWLGSAVRVQYEGEIPGIANSYFAVRKSESDHLSGIVMVGDEAHSFENESLLYVAAAVGVAIGVNGQKLDPALRGQDLSKLGKSIDLLVRGRFASLLLAEGEGLEKGAMQRLAPFHPKNLSSEHLRGITAWQHSGSTRDESHVREQVPAMTAQLRMRALHRLHRYTRSRRNPQTGEREYLLHRGASAEEKGGVVGNGTATTTATSSWTPSFGVAGRFTHKYAGKEGEPFRMEDPNHMPISAWIPESKIHHMPKFAGSLWGGPGKNHLAHENEVIVQPHSFQLASEQDLAPIRHAFQNTTRAQYGLPALRTPMVAKAISDIAPGNVMLEANGNKTFDYSHVLAPEHRAVGYNLLMHQSRYGGLTAELHHNGQAVGATRGDTDGEGGLHIDTADIYHDAHIGKGLGTAMYEAMMAHGKHHLGATHVSGDIHSTMASAVHQRLSAKHGMEYKPAPTPAPHLAAPTPGPHDARFGPYQYAIKQELNPSKPKPRALKKELLVTKSESERKCTECGGRQFTGSVFVGCLCFRGLAKSVKTSVTETGDYSVKFVGGDWDEDSIHALVSILKE
jgi:RimJ/RimL family protein N-acetyltransferase